MSSTEARHDTRADQDELSCLLLPALIHRANNATQLMSNLSTLARCGAGPSGLSWLEERSGDLADAARQVDQVGYLLAVVASASGADLLLERRAPRGLAWMTEAVGEALVREGRHMAAPTRPVPDLVAEVHEGWQLPWAVGALLAAAGLSGGDDETLEWQWLEDESSWVLVCACASPRAVAHLAGILEERLPESSLDVCERGWSWRVPAAWMRAH